MLITLISLAILLLSTMALIRSFDTSLSMAGNLAFKRDLINQGERGLAKAISLIKSGTLNVTNVANSNYSAAYLASDIHGLPLALINNTTFSASFSGADITDAASGVTVRYIIDRQCNAVGALDSSTCSSIDVGTKTTNRQAIYRISVRATGPRNTQTYLQSTVTR